MHKIGNAQNLSHHNFITCISIVIIHIYVNVNLSYLAHVELNVCLYQLKKHFYDFDHMLHLNHVKSAQFTEINLNLM